MKKLFGSLVLGIFLCVSGASALATPTQDAPKKEDTKKDDAAKTKKKTKKEKKTDKKEEKKDDKKPS